jgi:hypothetical protein
VPALTAILRSLSRRLTHAQPGLFWARYSRRARRLGLKRLYVLLSFDCDTAEDAAAAEELHQWLRQRDFKAAYAVPGVELEQHATEYARIAAAGGEFINHGWLPHAEWHADRYRSCTFYHEMSHAEIERDVRQGHEAVARVAGRAPIGFRTPHFGLFHEPAQLEFLHGLLNALGYRFSTSTLPRLAARLGPVSRMHGLFEAPLSGSFAAPLDLFDSWSFVDASGRRVTDRYADVLVETVDALTARGCCGVLNYYADPAHVAGNARYFDALARLRRAGVESLSYEDLLKAVTA